MGGQILKEGCIIDTQLIMMAQQMCQTYADKMRQGTLTEYEMLLYEQTAKTLTMYFSNMEKVCSIMDMNTTRDLYAELQRHKEWLGYINESDKGDQD